MTNLVAHGYIENPDRLVDEQMVALGGLRDVIAELEGGSPLEQLVMTSGAVTPTVGSCQVDTEAGDPADNLTTIVTTNMPDGRRIRLRSKSATRVVTLKHNVTPGAGTLFLTLAADLVLNDPTIEVLFENRAGTWYQVGIDYGASKALLRAFLGIATQANLDAMTDDALFLTSLKVATLLKQGGNIASASTLVVPTTANRGGRHHVTGTTNITALWSTTGYGWPVMLIFDGALTLVNSANLLLLGAGNIGTSAGDIAVFVPEASNVWRMVSYARHSGNPLDWAQTWLSAQTFTVFGTVEQTLTDGATVTMNGANGNVNNVTIAGNRTITASGLVAGRFYQLTVIQDATGGRVPTWNSLFKWKGGAAPNGSTSANAVDMYTFYSPDGTILREIGHNFDVR